MPEQLDKELAAIGESLDALGPALPLDDESAKSMVDRALQAHNAGGFAQQLSPWLAAAVALLACSVAAGLYLTGVVGGERDEPEPAAPKGQPSSTPALREASEPSNVPQLDDEAPIAEDTTDEPTDTIEGASRTTRVRRGPAQELAAANALRAKRMWRAAYKTYRRTYVRYPDSSEAYAARLAGAELLLRHLGRPKEARAQFERVITLSPHGSLAAAARHGLARSHRMTGNRTQEIAALQDLVLHHPQSPLAKLATERLRSVTESSQP